MYFDSEGILLLNDLKVGFGHITYKNKSDLNCDDLRFGIHRETKEDPILYFLSLYTTNFTEPLSYQDSAFLKLPKFP